MMPCIMSSAIEKSWILPIIRFLTLPDTMILYLLHTHVRAETIVSFALPCTFTVCRTWIFFSMYWRDRNDIEVGHSSGSPAYNMLTTFTTTGYHSVHQETWCATPHWCLTMRISHVVMVSKTVPSYTLSPTITGATPTLTLTITTVHFVTVTLYSLSSLAENVKVKVTSVRAPPCFSCKHPALRYTDRATPLSYTMKRRMQNSSCNNRHVFTIPSNWLYIDNNYNALLKYHLNKSFPHCNYPSHSPAHKFKCMVKGHYNACVHNRVITSACMVHCKCHIDSVEHAMVQPYTVIGVACLSTDDRQW